LAKAATKKAPTEQLAKPAEPKRHFHLVGQPVAALGVAGVSCIVEFCLTFAL